MGKPEEVETLGPGKPIDAGGIIRDSVTSGGWGVDTGEIFPVEVINSRQSDGRRVDEEGMTPDKSTSMVPEKLKRVGEGGDSTFVSHTLYKAASERAGLVEASEYVSLEGERRVDVAGEDMPL